ncbi:hypothetical protein [Naasia sp. SYSU D00057]|nr:hypothetical protein [Naasia sp. SYSU D00057]
MTASTPEPDIIDVVLVPAVSVPLISAVPMLRAVPTLGTSW